MSTEEDMDGSDISAQSGQGDNDDQDPAMRKFSAVVKILEEVADAEICQLEQLDTDFTDINARKARGARMLGQAIETLVKNINDDRKRKAENLLRTLQAKFARNSALLGIHLEAVGEIVEMMQSAVETQENDGTYHRLYFNMDHSS